MDSFGKKKDHEAAIGRIEVLMTEKSGAKN